MAFVCRVLLKSGSLASHSGRSALRAVAPAASECGLHTTAAAAQAKGKKGGAGPAAAAPAVEEKYDLTKQIPVSLLKEGPEPEYKPDSEYPPWLWKLLEEKPLLEDYVMKGLENVPHGEMKMVVRMINKRRIKEGNDARRKT